jgi:hypothetical protein
MEEGEMQSNCLYSFHVYPTQAFIDKYESKQPLALAMVVASAFVLMLGTFVVYDMFVFRRNKKILGEVLRSQAIVSSMFPTNVQDRLFANSRSSQKEIHEGDGRNKSRLKTFLSEGIENENFLSTKPIADLFLSTTVMFADLAGFTAWSSTREPSQVRSTIPWASVERSSFPYSHMWLIEPF